MKITHVLSSLIVLAIILTISSCGSDPAPEESVKDQQLAKLTTTWKVSKVELDGTVKTTDYPNFQLIISGTPGADSFGFNANGRPGSSPWPSSGNFTFGTDPETIIVRDDKVEMTYAVTADKLQLSFDFAGTGYPNSRVSNVKGKWIFNFTK
jgi:hypothetical protein